MARGFTFVEVLFAVILLGIGFIMIAGIFPTAIQQTAVVSDETQGTLICRGALRRIQEVAETRGNGFSNGNYLFPPTIYTVKGTPSVCAFSQNLNNTIGADAFFTGDRQYAWVGFYRRDSATDPLAHVYVLALRNPNFANYVTHYAPGETTPLSGTIQLPMVAPPVPPATFNSAVAPSAVNTPVQPLTVATLTVDPTTSTPYIQVAAGVKTANFTTGAYVIVANDNVTTLNTAFPTNPYPTAMVGRILRLGAEVTTGTTLRTFELQAGYDFLPQDLNYLTSVTSNPPPQNVLVFVVGRAPTLGGAYNEPVGYFTGPNQDIAVMSGYVHVNTSTN